jgi:hypothetical protein
MVCNSVFCDLDFNPKDDEDLAMLLGFSNYESSPLSVSKSIPQATILCIASSVFQRIESKSGRIGIEYKIVSKALICQHLGCHFNFVDANI